MNTLAKTQITEIVKHNYVHASVLFYFGIEFYNYSEQTLEQVCHEKGLELKSVVSKLEGIHKNNQPLCLDAYPIDLIVEYLKHAHYIFIKEKMPYIGSLIEKLNSDDAEYALISKDLKFVFPLFVEDFIHHIYEEEDTLFCYINRLNNFQKGKGNISKLYYDMERNNLSSFAAEHEEHDDEMAGIRQITDNYTVTESTPLHLKVIFAELQALEEELKTHAKIENDILFPKALILEQEVAQLFKQKVALN